MDMNTRGPAWREPNFTSRGRTACMWTVDCSMSYLSMQRLLLVASIAITTATDAAAREATPAIVISENPPGVSALQLFSVQPDGSGRTQLTHCAYGCQQPVWAPDGRRIVFTEQTPTGMHLLAMNANGSNQQVLAAEPGVQHILPTFLNSTHVAFARVVQKDAPTVNYTRCRGPLNGIVGHSLYTVNLQTAEQAPLFAPGVRPAGSWASMPSASPSGARIAFVGAENSSDVPRLWIASADGTGAAPASPGATLVDLQGDGCITPITQKVPAWSPDGDFVAHWEGVEMSYLSHFTGIPDPQRDMLITQGNLAQGGTYPGWRVWSVQVPSAEAGAGAGSKVDEGNGDDPVWAPDGRLTRAYPAQTPSNPGGGPLVMIQTAPHGASWQELPIMAPNTPSWGRFAWRSTSVDGK